MISGDARGLKPARMNTRGISIMPLKLSGEYGDAVALLVRASFFGCCFVSTIAYIVTLKSKKLWSFCLFEIQRNLESLDSLKPRTYEKNKL